MAEYAESIAVAPPLPVPAGAQSSAAVPGIVFENKTPYDALQFDTIDQHGAAFHVFVARIGYRIEACGTDGWSKLTALAVPARLNTEDVHIDGNLAASVLEESDLAPYKPRCDVIVNATAHAPQGRPTTQFPVGLRVERHDAAPAFAGKGATQREALIDKTLVVCGARSFKRKFFITRWLQFPVRIFTFGLMRPTSWRLGKAATVTELPLRYEFACGGECRINRDDERAKRVPARVRLADSDSSPSKPGQAVAHEVCESNPVGRGFVRNWYLRTTGIRRIPAPQISYADRPISARHFQICADGGDLPSPAGLGAVGRAWLPRRALIGQIKEKTDWGADEIPSLPEEFDYAYWNSAPADQQCAYLQGEETVTLMNLCEPGSPVARVNQRGDSVLRFKLPRQAVVALLAKENNQLIVLPLEIDTVIINPGSQRVDLVWRANVMADPSLVQARLMHATEQDQLERLGLLTQHQWSDDPTTEVPNSPTKK